MHVLLMICLYTLLPAMTGSIFEFVALLVSMVKAKNHSSEAICNLAYKAFAVAFFIAFSVSMLCR